MTKNQTRIALQEELSGTTSLTRIVFPVGRGFHGKSAYARWQAEEAQEHGRPLLIADADRTNPTLSKYISGVVRPPSSEEGDMRDWSIATFNTTIETRVSTIVDFGGGDLVLKKLAREMDLVRFFGDYDVGVTILHFIGPDLDDLAYLRDMEKDGLLAPEATILVLNQALVPVGRSSETAFAPVLEHRFFREALDRRARVVVMPRLVPIQEVDARLLTFGAAAEGKTIEGLPPIGPFNRSLIARWRRDMKANFTSVAEWLP
ncbi:MAG: hypothetical protein ACRYHQ_02975 [Janthinobacterium lividum]